MTSCGVEDPFEDVVVDFVLRGSVEKELGLFRLDDEDMLEVSGGDTLESRSEPTEFTRALFFLGEGEGEFLRLYLEQINQFYIGRTEAV